MRRIPTPEKNMAETSYREAFERLRNNTPRTLPIGSPVTQNNVAREAGVDPSALRKSRYPQLIKEIQLYTLEHRSKPAAQAHNGQKSENRKRTLAQRLADTQKQRDELAIALNRSNAQVLSLKLRIIQLEDEKEKTNVIRLIKPPG